MITTFKLTRAKCARHSWRRAGCEWYQRWIITRFPNIHIKSWTGLMTSYDTLSLNTGSCPKIFISNHQESLMVWFFLTCLSTHGTRSLDLSQPLQKQVIQLAERKHRHSTKPTTSRAYPYVPQTCKTVEKESTRHIFIYIQKCAGLMKLTGREAGQLTKWVTCPVMRCLHKSLNGSWRHVFHTSSSVHQFASGLNCWCLTQ
jgi:hypothetical protein